LTSIADDEVASEVESKSKSESKSKALIRGSLEIHKSHDWSHLHNQRNFYVPMPTEQTRSGHKSQLN